MEVSSSSRRIGNVEKCLYPMMFHGWIFNMEQTEIDGKNIYRFDVVEKYEKNVFNRMKRMGLVV